MHLRTIDVPQTFGLGPERTIHKGFLGAPIGTEVPTDLDYADDVAHLAEMLSVLVLALEVMHEEARLYGLEINWSKTKIQTSADIPDKRVAVRLM